MVVSPDRLEALRQILSDEILNQFAEALLDCSSLENLRNPVLRLEAFVENGDNQSDNRKRNRDQGSPIVSVRLPSAFTQQLRLQALFP